MKIKYINIEDQSVVFEEEDKLFILYNDGVKSERSEYYFHSQFWNGLSPFFPVNIEADSFIDVCKKDSDVLNMFFEHNVSIIRDMINIGLSNNNLTNKCKDSALETVEYIFSVINLIKV